MGAPDYAAGVTYVITNFNGRQVLPGTLSALYSNACEIFSVIVIDDGSTDGSRAWLQQHYPQVIVSGPIANTRNVNAIRNLGLEQVRTRYVFLMDNDITIERGCVERLLQVARSEPDIHCLTPRLLDVDQPDRIFADGNSLHYLGLSGRAARGIPVHDRPSRPPEPTFGGGIMLIDMEAAKQVGHFDTEYLWGWGEDAEYQLRGRLLGYQALLVSDAVCLHESKQHGTGRAYAQLCNRYRLLFTFYTAHSLLLLAPGLLLFEAAISVASVMKGFWRERFGAIGHVWRLRREIRQRRQYLQAHRRRADGALIRGGPFDLPGMMLDRRLVRLLADALAAMTQLNWRMVQKWI